MPLNCFCAAAGNGVDQAPRPVSLPGVVRTKKASFRRQGSNTSSMSSRSGSNASIARLPPCKRMSEEDMEKKLMPVPDEQRQSRCLRFSHPRIYSDIVTDMRLQKGCRDWKNFAVFHDDDVDTRVSAEAYAKKRAADYEKRCKELASFSSSEGLGEDSIDTIG